MVSSLERIDVNEFSLAAYKNSSKICRMETSSYGKARSIVQWWGKAHLKILTNANGIKRSQSIHRARYAPYSTEALETTINQIQIP